MSTVIVKTIYKKTTFDTLINSLGSPPKQYCPEPFLTKPRTFLILNF